MVSTLPAHSRARPRSPDALIDYAPGPNAWDEAFAAPGEPRELYRDLLAELAERDLAEMSAEVSASATEQGATFGRNAPFILDPVPRLIADTEWDRVAAGLRQRLRALNAFCADVYSDQRIFNAGIVPRALLDSGRGYEPLMRGLLDPAQPAVSVAGTDLIRDEAGRLLVLEDNLRMPSGAGYALAARRAISSLFDTAPGVDQVVSFLAVISEAVRAAGRHGGSDALVVILSDGPGASTRFEHEAMSRVLQAPIVSPDELETVGGELFARINGRRTRVDVIYRRLDEERLSDADGNATALGELLLPALRSGNVRCANAFGTAVADDKLAHAYVEQMISFYLTEDPILPSVPSFGLADPHERGACLDRIGELVVKQRDGFGGSDVVLLPLVDESRRRNVIAAVRRAPEDFVAQEMLTLSTHPTVCDGRLAPRHLDLRPFAVAGAGGEITVMPGGLTRFARAEGELVVNSSRGGGGKDTWVVSR